LILTRFQPGRATPVHDHGSWAVAYVVDGRERYVHWQRLDDGSDPRRADVKAKYERTLGPGDAVYWFDPPHDIHSQEAVDGVAWELLLFGRNPQQRTLQYFDPKTGLVTRRVPIAPVAAPKGD
jgi:predicted metal-dependent enzyme (double-stranded beta helix superfamily)